VKKFTIILILVLGLTASFLYIQLDTIVETGINTAGPEALKVDVEVENVSLSPLSGDVAVTNLSLGQPEGFGDGPMAQVGDFSMKLETSTLLNDHIIIDRMVIDAPMLDVRRQDGNTNFQAFQERLGLIEDEADSASAVTLTIRRLEVKAPRILAKNDGFFKLDEDITLADFTLTDLGTDEKGLAPKEIARHVMDTLQPQITKALLAAGASNKIKQIAKDAKGTLEQGVGGLLGVLKKKKKENDPQ